MREYDKTDCSVGGSRKTFLLKNSVLKVPNDFGCIGHFRDYDTVKQIFSSEDCNADMEQTFAEWHVWEMCPPQYRYLLCPILEYGFTDDGMPYTMMERAKPFCQWDDECYPEDQYEEHGGIAEDYMTQEDLFLLCLDQNEISYPSTLIEDIDALCIFCNISSVDIFSNLSNVGSIDGKFTIFDYGYEHNWGDSNIAIDMEDGQII